MKEAEIVNIFLHMQHRFSSVGLTLLSSICEDNFGCNDVPGSRGIVVFQTLKEAETFIRGYEFAYKASL